MQMFVKSVNLEGIFNFTFGTGKDENLILNPTEFIDNKMYAGGDNSGDRDDRSSDDLNGQPEPSAQLDPETTQVPSTSVHNRCPYRGWPRFDVLDKIRYHTCTACDRFKNTYQSCLPTLTLASFHANRVI